MNKRFTTCSTCGGLCHYPSENFKSVLEGIGVVRNPEDVLPYFTDKEIREEFARRFGGYIENFLIDIGLAVRTNLAPSFPLLEYNDGFLDWLREKNSKTITGFEEYEFNIKNKKE